MGLTSKSTGAGAVDNKIQLERTAGERVVALAGNPNVGKSTVFNALTGMNQHTGNWPGKTVSNAVGRCEWAGEKFILVDIPGTYSLVAHSAEEEVARDFICFGEPDAVIVLCDATCLERNLNLVLQTLEITPKTVVAVNLLDEAKKKKIHVDLTALEKQLRVPVVGMTARSGEGLQELMAAVQKVCAEPPAEVQSISYPPEIEEALNFLSLMVCTQVGERLNPRWTAAKLLDGNRALLDSMNAYLGFDILDGGIDEAVDTAKTFLRENGVEGTALSDRMVSAAIKTAEAIAVQAVTFEKDDYYERDRKIDRILTHRWLGVPIMAALLGVIFWITLAGANYPSQLLSGGLFWLGERLRDFLLSLNAPSWLEGAVVDGIYRVLAWVVAVMLPPMAIFFPLFTILEDLGYLPRVAFNLDKHFKKACACGKQALTMWIRKFMLIKDKPIIGVFLQKKRILI